MLSRRDLLKHTGQTYLAAGAAPLISSFITAAPNKSMRCINVVNFIRGVEPRFEIDLLLPVQKQMELIVAHKLPATWLLQYDALVAGPFVEFLKAHMAKNHEVGFWFEMNEMLCKAAKVEWRGRAGYEWDHFPPVAFTIGYTHEERIKLADTAMAEFKKIWGQYPKSVASWNLDSVSLAHLSDKYGVDAYAVCRDQIATDGFTIWGAPIAGYYPSKTNCWSPALDRKNQISTPIFRMLGQDPVYYYNLRFPLPSGQMVQQPITMEPVWVSGRSPVFIKEFLNMISDEPTMQFGYAQLGQENSFPWPDQAEAYPKQMAALAALRDSGSVHVETMGDSGRRFKKAFSITPVQSQVLMNDPFGNTKPAESSVWYQSRFYRANLHFRGDLPFLRDLTVYSDRNPQPYLDTATRSNDVEQRMPAILDGFHWSKSGEAKGQPGSGGFFQVGEERLRLSGKPAIREDGKTLIAELPVGDGRLLSIRFEEKKISFRLTPKGSLSITFEWDPAKAALVEVRPQAALYKWQGFDYALAIGDGMATATKDGFTVSQTGREIGFSMAQAS